MPHWDEVQVGDKIVFDDWDKSTYQIVQKIEFADGWKFDFFSFKDRKTYKDDYRHGFFDYASVVIQKSKEEQILEKIKYLDKRYHDRRVSV